MSFPHDWKMALKSKIGRGEQSLLSAGVLTAYLHVRPDLLFGKHAQKLSDLYSTILCRLFRLVPD